jgi:lipoprotein-anchoring transpeptidase ErfK/SrfK
LITWIKSLPSLLVGVSLAGCATTDPRLTSRETQYIGAEQSAAATRDAGLPPWDNVSYWDGQGLNGPARVEIDLRAQRAYFYKGGKLAGVSTVSTGREGYNTPPGTFRITQKNPDHRSNLFGDYVDADGNVIVKDVDARKDLAPPGTKFLGAPMPNFMRFHGGIGMHAGYLPGYAASHGCVRLPPKMARHFFNNVSVGTPVTVVN